MGRDVASGFGGVGGMTRLGMKWAFSWGECEVGNDIMCPMYVGVL